MGTHSLRFGGQFLLQTVKLLPDFTANGQFQFTLSGDVGQSYRVDTTTNLNNPASWLPLRTNIAYGGSFTFTDNNAHRAPPRYYRAVRVP